MGEEKKKKKTNKKRKFSGRWRMMSDGGIFKWSLEKQIWSMCTEWMMGIGRVVCASEKKRWMNT